VELYKYCKVAHHDSLLSRGSLRVGTLHDYRCKEAYGELVADEHEGKKLLEGFISHLDAESAVQYPGIEALHHAGLVNIDLSTGGTITNLTIENAVSESTNLLIFSTASEYSEEIHEHWRKAEGYNACYKIISARLFFRAISRALGVNYSFLGFGPVIYEDSLDLKDPRSHVHPAMIKRRTEFFGQAEFRGVWSSIDTTNASPVLIETSNACLYATSYRMLPPFGA